MSAIWLEQPDSATQAQSATPAQRARAFVLKPSLTSATPQPPPPLQHPIATRHILPQYNQMSPERFIG
ncbi:hypothetical protein BRAS3809_2940007 [Bradyrhizobium sp. STM 3809]|nr:hypothetical protein BRAS3809_2940007 [Bradyrhizobium sp. STM 3809]